jgi:hypothetical protein
MPRRLASTDPFSAEPTRNKLASISNAESVARTALTDMLTAVTLSLVLIGYLLSHFSNFLHAQGTPST